MTDGWKKKMISCLNEIFVVLISVLNFLVLISILLNIGSRYYCFDFFSNSFCFNFFSGKYWKRNVPSGVSYIYHVHVLEFKRRCTNTPKTGTLSNRVLK